MWQTAKYPDNKHVLNVQTGYCYMPIPDLFSYNTLFAIFLQGIIFLFSIFELLYAFSTSLFLIKL